MLKTIGTVLLAIGLLLLSRGAFPQAWSELHQTEPGSMLFGVLQLTIGTTAIVAAYGLVRRTRWAVWSIGICGVAVVALLAVQPLYEPMSSDASQSIWLGAAGIGILAGGVAWWAHRLARSSAQPRR